MKTLRIRNWDKWQSYRRDRGQPPWIKIQRALIRDPDWVALSDAQRGQLVAIWILAADRDGVIPASPQLLKKLCYMDTDPPIQLFMDHGFIERDANVTPIRRQADAPEAEAEAETEAEGEDAREAREPPPDGLDGPSWKRWRDYRKKIRKPIKPVSVLAAQRKLAAFGADQASVVEQSIANGWTGLFALKDEAVRVGVPRKTKFEQIFGSDDDG